MKYWPYFSTAVSTAATLYDTYTGGSGQELYRQLRDYTAPQTQRRRKTTTGTVVENKRKNNNMSNGTYTMSRRRIRRGRKISYAKYVDRVVSQNLVHVKERFGAISDPSDTLGNNRGAYFINHGQVTATTSITIDGVLYGGYMQYPIHCWPLFNTSQNPTAFGSTNLGNGGYELIGGTPGGTIPGRLAWKRIGGWSKDRVIAPGVYNNQAAGAVPWDIVAPELIDNESLTSSTLGRQAILEWFNAKTLVYGKKTRPTYITFSLVTFPDEQFAPDYEWTRQVAATLTANEGRLIEGVADEFWRARLRRLIANPCSESTVVNTEKKLRVLSRKVVKLAPKESIDSDTDPHQQFINWFERVNKPVDFSTHYVGATDTINDTLMANPNYVQQPAVKIGQIPGNKMYRNMYILVESYAPDQNNWTYNELGAGATNPSNSSVASYDFTIKKSWVKVD